jgi:DNA end-binding protein Ku
MGRCGGARKVGAGVSRHKLPIGGNPARFVLDIPPLFSPSTPVSTEVYAMATAIWKGALTFGLVNIPVRLQSAVRSNDIRFRMLHEDDLSPVKYQRICEKEGKPIPWGEIVKGYEYTKGRYVVLDDDDFRKAALESSKQIEVLDFVAEEEVDPRYFDTPYYLVPEKGGERAYALLREAIRATGTIGIGKVTIRTKQHLAGVKVVGDALVLDLMRFNHELVETEEISFPEADEVRPKELTMAKQLIQNFTSEFEPEKYTDEYRENLMEIIQGKLKGKKVEFAEPDAPDATGVIDLMSRLQESLKQSKERQGGGAKKKPAARKPAAKGAGAKKQTQRKSA